MTKQLDDDIHAIMQQYHQLTDEEIIEKNNSDFTDEEGKIKPVVENIVDTAVSNVLATPDGELFDAAEQAKIEEAKKQGLAINELLGCEKTFKMMNELIARQDAPKKMSIEEFISTKFILLGRFVPDFEKKYPGDLVKIQEEKQKLEALMRPISDEYVRRIGFYARLYVYIIDPDTKKEIILFCMEPTLNKYFRDRVETNESNFALRKCNAAMDVFSSAGYAGPLSKAINQYGDALLGNIADENNTQKISDDRNLLQKEILQNYALFAKFNTGGQVKDLTQLTESQDDVGSSSPITTGSMNTRDAKAQVNYMDEDMRFDE